MSYREQYEAWKSAKILTAQEVQELSSLSDEKEIEDRFYRELAFGTAGMRGLLGLGTNRMNRFTVGRLTLALAESVREAGGEARGVAIGYDSRHFSAEFAKEVSLILAARGVRAYLFDALRPVPLLSFALRHLNCMAGVVITASHNPPQYNGYKVYWQDGGQLPPEPAERVMAKLSEFGYFDAAPMDEGEALKKGLLTMIGEEVDDAYIAAIKRLSVNPALAREMGKALKVVYSPLHGTGNLPVRRILQEIGVENVYVVPEQEMPDGSFPTVRVPNPEERDALDMAIRLQEKLGADLSVASDPDCDRVGVACLTAPGEARLLDGNQIGCVLLHYILSQKKALGTLPANAAVVKSIVSTDMARAICKDFGAELFEVLTGFKFIAEKIQQFEETGDYTFQFGFEESYGYLSGTDVRDKDGVNACMLIAEAACFYKQRGMTLVDAIEALYAQYGHFGERTISLTFPGKDGLEKMRGIMAGLRKAPPAAIGDARVTNLRDYMPESDVLYFELDGGWACVRPSGTEPKIKVYAGAVSRSHEETEALLDQYTSALKRALGMEDTE